MQEIVQSLNIASGFVFSNQKIFPKEMILIKNEAMEFINRFTKHGAPVTDLTRFRSLMERLGNPQNKLKFIHVAGTNGKGSTVRFCAQALAAAGYKTGEFTSPFIVEYADRIRINGKNIPYEAIAKYAQIVQTAAGDSPDYSQFEITNAIAFLYYLDEKCDVVVLETGIGGLLDSTNIVETTLVSVITSIDYDHTRILGDTLEAIALHKAGIIKPGVPAVLSCENPASAERVVRDGALKAGSRILLPDLESLAVEECGLSGSRFLYKGNRYTLQMPGRHQIINALSAIEALELLHDCGFSIPLSAVQKGLREAAVCARAEVVSQNPLRMIDGAHNPSGARALAALLKSLPKKGVVLVVGMLAEKNAALAVKELAAVCDTAVCVDDFHPAALQSAALSAFFEACGVPAVCAGNTLEALRKADELAGGDGAVIFCGSLYLAAEARQYLL